MDTDSSSVANDTTTEYVVTLMAYYTREFKEKNGDNTISTIRNAVKMANAGYKNSGVPLKVRIHCIKEIRGTESQNQKLESQKGMERIEVMKEIKGTS